MTDAAGTADPSFEWHEFAKIWQTPGAGEEYLEEQLERPGEERAGVFERSRGPREQAVRIAGLDRTMAGLSRILTLSS